MGLFHSGSSQFETDAIESPGDERSPVPAIVTPGITVHSERELGIVAFLCDAFEHHPLLPIGNNVMRTQLLFYRGVFEQRAVSTLLSTWQL